MTDNLHPILYCLSSINESKTSTISNLYKPQTSVVKESESY